MAIPLYDASVATFLQVLGGVSNFLDKGLKHCQAKGIGDRLCGLDGPSLRTADQPGYREPRQRLRQTQGLLEAFVEAAPLLAAGDDAGCMNRIALRMQPPKVASQEASSVPDR